MDMSETFSPGPSTMGLNEMAFPCFLCTIGQCTHWTAGWINWRRGEPLWQNPSYQPVTRGLLDSPGELEGVPDRLPICERRQVEAG